jgi:hypothetical protein
MPDYPSQPEIPQYPQINPLGSDPQFLRYLQGYLTNPKNTDMIQKKRISAKLAVTGQGLVLDTKGIWSPQTVLTSSGISGTINLAKLTGGGSNGSITVVNGAITAFTNPT